MDWKDNTTEEDAWNDAIRTDTIECYQHYLSYYSVHATEANIRLAELEQERKEKIIKDLSEDRNAWALSYLKCDGIQPNDLVGILRDSNGQVRDEVLKSWDKLPRNRSLGKVVPIPKGRTEFYFWGICASGKTTVMASVLNEANKQGILHPELIPSSCNLIGLLKLFSADPWAPAVWFPTGDVDDSVSWSPFHIKDGRFGHHCAFMEINWSIFDTIWDLASGKPVKMRKRQATLDETMGYLQNKDNPKYHFFLLDGHRMCISSEEEQLILCTTLQYLNEQGVFDRNTLGASLIVTKCDRLSPNRKEWLSVARDFLMDNFRGLVGQLKSIACEKFSNSKINVFPFSVGEQFLKQLCIYNPDSAKVLLNEVLNILSPPKADCVANPILRI